MYSRIHNTGTTLSECGRWGASKQRGFLRKPAAGQDTKLLASRLRELTTHLQTPTSAELNLLTEAAEPHQAQILWQAVRSSQSTT